MKTTNRFKYSILGVLFLLFLASCGLVDETTPDSSDLNLLKRWDALSKNVEGITFYSHTTNGFTVSWEAPTNGGTDGEGKSVSNIGYRINWKKSSETDYSSVETSVSNLTYTISGLEQGVEYDVLVQVKRYISGKVSYVDIQMASTWTPAVPDIPRKITLGTTTTNSLVLNWLTPGDTGKNPEGTILDITGYMLEYSSANGSWIVLSNTGSGISLGNEIGTNNTATVVGLTADIGTVYQFRLSAVNEVGVGLSALVRVLSSKYPDNFIQILDSQNLNGNDLAAIIALGKIPSNLNSYDESSRDIFRGYASGATVVARYVLPGGRGKKDGSSWYDASDSLKTVLDGITDAAAGKVYAVLLGPGVYKSGSEMAMQNYVTIVGEVSPNNTIPDNVHMRPTILSGEGSYRVFKNERIKGTARLYGVTIADGFIHSDGGGMLNNNSSPVLIEVIFSNNISGHNGGGIYNSYSSPFLSKVVFTSNSSAYHGGGMGSQVSESVLIDVVFSKNKSLYGGGMQSGNSSLVLTAVEFSENMASNGGGMYNYEMASLIMTGVVFSDNTADFGGGMYNSQSSPVIEGGGFFGNRAIYSGGGIFHNRSYSVLNKVTISDNKAEIGGGGLFNYYSSPELTKVILSGNMAQNGGGMYNAGISSPSLNKVIFIENTADEFGGGMYNNYSYPVLTGVIFSKNMAKFSGSVIYNNRASSTVVNSIFWNNSDNEILDDVNVYYSVVEGGASDSISNIIIDDPELGNLADNGGGISTMAIPTNSSAVNKGVYVRRSVTRVGEDPTNQLNYMFYYSIDNFFWYDSPALDKGGNPVTPPSDAINITVADMTGYLVRGRPDIGVYESRGEDNISKVPDIPGEIIVERTSSNSIVLSWSAPTNTGLNPDGSKADITEYVLEYSNASGDWMALITVGNGVRLSDKIGTSTSAMIEGLTVGGVYGFRVVAVNQKGASSPTDVIVIKADWLMGLSVTPPSLNLFMSSNAVLTAALYPTTATNKITWSSSDTNVATVIDNGNGSATVTAVFSGTTKITVRSGRLSVVVTVSGIPNSPKNVRHINVNKSTEVDLVWDASPGADRHEIYQVENNVKTLVGTTTNSSYTVSGLTPDTYYDYEIKSCFITLCSSSVSIGVVTGLSSNGKDLAAIIASGKIPSDLNEYDESSRAIFEGYASGATVVARYILPVGRGKKDGSSWYDASDSLKTVLEGIKDAGEGKIYAVLLGSGEYKAGGKMAMKNYVTIVGGVSLNNTIPVNAVLLPTILSGESSYRVFHHNNNGLDSTARLYGVTIADGKADNGGGMNNASASPSLTKVIFSGNTADVGGGLYNWNSSTLLNKVVFSGNTASTYGGGMYSGGSGSSPSLTEVIFSGNNAGSTGGGLYNWGSSVLFNKVVFSGNMSFDGGGLANFYSSIVLTGVTFSNNMVTNVGGGMYNSHSSPTLTGVEFTGNTAGNSGGGMFNNSSSPVLNKVLFSGSKANDGGGMFNDISSPVLNQVVFSGNTAGSRGGAMFNNDNSSPIFTGVVFSGNTTSNVYRNEIFNDDSTFTAVNSIFWGDGSDIIYGLYGESPSLYYSVVKDGKPDSTNNIITVDPKLGELADNGGDIPTISIAADSPAVNKGLYVRRKGSTHYYSINNFTWYDSPVLDKGGTVVNLPSDAIDLTSEDMTGYLVRGRPDIGVYEARGENDGSKVVTTVPSAPERLVMKRALSNAMVLNWSAPTDTGLNEDESGAELTHYVLQYSNASGEWVDLSESSSGVRLSNEIGTDTSATVEGLTGGAVYGFRVAAVNQKGGGSPTEALVIKTDWLMGLSITPPSLDLFVSSNAVLTAVIYPSTATNKITWSSSDVNVARVVDNGNGSATVTAVFIGTATITVRGGELSAEARVMGVLDSPKNVRQTNFSKTTEADLVWDPSPGADRYELYQVKNDVKTLEETLINTSYTVRGLTPNSYYDYEIKSCFLTLCSSPASISVVTGILSNGKDLAAIIASEEIPSDLNTYDESSRAIFGEYASGSTVVARYILPGGKGKRDGSSWSDASDSLKTVLEGIKDANADKVYAVLLGPGEYKAGAEMAMKNYVTIVGGVSPNNTILANAAQWPTTLSGENSYRVFHHYYNGLNSTAHLYGVTIADGKVGNGGGGGMFNINSSPALTEVIFLNNTSSLGGGMYNQNSSPVLIGVVFSSNTAGNGGGMYNNSSSPVLSKVVFSGNTAGSAGAMYNYFSSPILTGVVFSGNKANAGGGMYNSSSSPILTGVVFSGNTAFHSKSGAMYNNSSPLTVVNSIFWGNSSSVDGEGIHLHYSVVKGGKPDSTNNIIIADPKLGELTDNGGGIPTISIAADSPAVNRGIYVRRKGSTHYYSINNFTWYDSPALDKGGTVVNLPSDAIDLTFTDMTGYPVRGRPDIGVYEARGENDGSKVVTTVPSAPGRIVVNRAISNIIVLNWSAPGNTGLNEDGSRAELTHYVLQYSNASGEWIHLSESSSGVRLRNEIGTNTSATVEGLTGGAVYGFRVTAVNQKGGGSPTEALVIRTDWLIGLSVTPPSLDLFVSSNAVLTAVVYPSTATNKITWSSSDVNVARVVDNGNGSATVTAVFIGTATITVRGGVFSAEARVTVVLNSPKNVRQTNFSKTTEADLVWDASPGADRYEIYQVENDVKTLVGTTTNASYTVAGLRPNTYYDYEIKSCFGTSCSSPASISVVTGILSNGKDLAAIIASEKIPLDLHEYDESSLAIFANYNYGSTVVVRYILPGGRGKKNGSSWSDASASLKTVLEGIKDANADKVYAVLLGPGEYKAGAEMAMKNYVTIVGGVSPNNTIPANAAQWPTTLSGENSYRVFYHYNNGLNSTARLYGVVIADGKANYGGGMHNYNSSPVLTGVLFKGNAANSIGGGMYNLYSSPVLSKVVFSGNTADPYGGGMANFYSSSLVLSEVIFLNNYAPNGGGMYNYYSSPVLSKVVFAGNRAHIGAGMYNAVSSPVLLIGTVFTGNSSSYYGDIYNNADSSPIAVNSIFWGDNSSYNGRDTHWYYSVVKGGKPDSTNNIITADPKLGELTDNGGGIPTISIAADSPAVNRGIYVRRKGSTHYYSINNFTWYDSPALDKGGTVVNLPSDAIDLTFTDMTGYPVRGRPDIGVYEARGENDGSKAVTTVPSAPERLVMKRALSNAMVLNWSAPGNTGLNEDGSRAELTHYVLQYSNASGEWIHLSESSSGVRLRNEIGTNTSATVEGLTGGAVYGFRVTAVNQKGGGSPTEALVIRTDWLIGLSVTPPSLDLFVSSNAVLTAVIYPSTATNKITWSSSDVNVARVVDNGNGSATVTAVFIGTATITVRGGVFSAEARVTVVLNSPKNVRQTNFSKTTEADLVWDASPGADRYEIYQVENDVKTLVGTTTNASYTVAGLRPNTYYDYEIKSCFGTSCSSPASISVVTGILSNGKDLAAIIASGKIPLDLHEYDESSLAIFANYNYGSTVVVRYILPGGRGKKNGSSWSDASASLKTVLEGIKDANADKVYAVLLGPGEYKAGAEMAMKNYVTIVGGVSLNNTIPSNAAQWPTTLSGESSYRVFHHDGNGLNSTARLYGVTIVDGNTTDKGGGMFNNESSPVLTEVIFLNNTAYRGGGMHNSSSSPVLIGVVFSSNNTADQGGGMYNFDSSPVLSKVVFSGNTANRGGGMHNNSSSSVLSEVVFSGNRADFGAGMFNDNSSPVLTGTVFFGNWAVVSGGGIYNNFSSLSAGVPSLTAVNSIFWGNSSSVTGGSAHLYYSVVKGGNPDSTNNIITVDPKLGELADNGGVIPTISIAADSPAVNKGLYVRRKGSTHYYSINNFTWYDSPALDKGGNVVILPSDTIDLTFEDMTGYLVRGRPDIGVYEARGENDGSKVVTTVPSAPERLVMKRALSNAMVLNWSAPGNTGLNEDESGAELTHYVLQYSNASGEWVDLSESSSGVRLSNEIGTDTSATVEGLTEGAVYGFRVAAVNQKGGGSPTEALVIKTDWLMGLSITPPSLDLFVSSNAVLTAVIYPSTATNKITWSSSDVNVARVVDNGNGSATVTAVFIGTATITVRGGELSAEARVMGVLDSPKNVRQTNFSKTTEADLVWDPSPGADRYELYQVENDVKTLVGTTTNTSYTVAGLSNLVYYTYEIKSCFGTSCSSPVSISVITGVPSNGKDLAAIIASEEIPSDLNTYDESSRTIFGGYASGAAVVARYILPGGKGKRDGSSWSDASGSLKTILEGIKDAGAGKVYAVLLGPGEYKGGGAMSMKNYVTIVGGVSPNNTILANAAQWPTTLSGENSYRVFYHYNNGLNSTARLYGVMIADGKGDTGGGMFNRSSSPVLSEVIFLNNYANNGGGIYNYDSSPVLTGVVFKGNTANDGAGMYNYYSSPVLSKVVFSGNTSDYYGGGMYNDSSSPKLTQVVFFKESANQGGGMYNSYSSPVFSKVLFAGNTASYGGGMFNAKSSPVLTGMVFTGNTAKYYSGDIYNSSGSSPIAVNSIFWGNNSSVYGGGAHLYYSVVKGGKPDSTNNIITVDPKLGELADNGGDIPTISIAADSPAVNRGIYVRRKGSTHYYSINNFTWYDSPALDKGGTVVNLPSDAIDLTFTDMTGYPVRGRPDIGVYEARGENDGSKVVTTVPSAPGRIVVNRAISNIIVLNWSAPGNTGLNEDGSRAELTHYVLQYSNASGEWIHLSESSSGVRLRNEIGTNTSATVEGLTGGAGYGFRVTAVNQKGGGSPTEALVIRTDWLIGLSITPPSLDLFASSNAVLTAVVYPSTATNKIVWSSSDVNVARVVDNGNGSASVTAVFMGTAMITAKSGSLSAVATVSVVLDSPKNVRQTNFSKTTEVDLLWDASPGAHGYEIYQVENDIKTLVGSTKNPSYTARGLTPNTYYDYEIKSCAGWWCSSPASIGVATGILSKENGKNLAAIIASGKVPSDLNEYDESSRAVFGEYASGATVVARYILPGGRGKRDGSSWSDASDSLKTVLGGIEDAVSGKVYAVLLGPGEYKAGGAMSMKNHVTIVGGVSSNNTIPANAAQWPTTLSGENSYRVFYHGGNGLDSTARLYGITIANGVSDYGSAMANIYSSPALTEVIISNNTARFGGGMYNYDSSPVLSRVVFSGNTSDNYGGGIYNILSPLILTDVVFSGNTAIYGGGMYNKGFSSSDSSLSLTGVVFTGNSATLGGGGMYNSDYSVVLTETVFSNNTAGNNGGGLYVASGSPKLIKVVFSGNSAADGGGMYSVGSSPSLSGVVFSGNSSTNGGGMYNYASALSFNGVVFLNNTAVYKGGGIYGVRSYQNITKVIFSGNTASDGGGMYNNFSSPILTEVIFSGNTDSYSGGMYNYQSTPTAVNSIFWGNSRSNGIYNEGGGINLYYSVVQGWEPDSTNNIITTDPKLGELAYNGGGIPTVSIPADSPAVNQGLYVRRRYRKYYYSINNFTWYDSPALNKGGNIVSLPFDTIDLTASDMTGYPVSGRPDIGVYEARGENVSSKVATASSIPGDQKE